MNDAPRQTLRELIARHGQSLCSDARRCEGLLRDHCGEHRREVNLLVSALRERVPLDLLAAQGSVPRGLLLTRLARRLEDQMSVTAEAARWAVDSWALALGVATDAEVAEREREYARAEPRTPPPATADDARKGTQGQPQAPRTAPAPQPQQKARPPRQPPPARPPQPTQAPAPLPPARPPARRNPFAWPRSNAPAQPQPDPAFTQGRPDYFRPPGLLWSFRGCVMGCLLLVVLTFVIFFGVPFVLSVLREEQQQRTLEPAPVRTQ